MPGIDFTRKPSEEERKKLNQALSIGAALHNRAENSPVAQGFDGRIIPTFSPELGGILTNGQGSGDNYYKPIEVDVKTIVKNSQEVPVYQRGAGRSLGLEVKAGAIAGIVGLVGVCLGISWCVKKFCLGINTVITNVVTETNVEAGESDPLQAEGDQGSFPRSEGPMNLGRVGEVVTGSNSGDKFVQIFFEPESLLNEVTPPTEGDSSLKPAGEQFNFFKTSDIC